MSPFNEQGDLPSGVHQAMLAEVLERFGHGAPQRVIVTERLQRVIALAQGTGKLERVFIWGSYVTDKPEPGDIDLFLVMSPDFVSNAYTGANTLGVRQRYCRTHVGSHSILDDQRGRHRANGSKLP